jgi:uncharacterized protein (TIGR02452 family)
MYDDAPAHNSGKINKRSRRATLAIETLGIAEHARYSLPGNLEVDLGTTVRDCVARTQYFSPDALKGLLPRQLEAARPWEGTRLELRNESTLAAARAMVASGQYQHVAALNFASAKNPGGGFLNGSLAQEESLAVSSALYLSLRKAEEYYNHHRHTPNLLYSERMIYSPACPVFRDDAGELLYQPYLLSILTSAAPNAGAIRQNTPELEAQIPAVFRERAQYVLALAASKGVDALILGAWGCGVFRNDPTMVARTFAELLRPGGDWHGRFATVRFAVLDTHEPPVIFQAFADVLTNLAGTP